MHQELKVKILILLEKLEEIEVTNRDLDKNDRKIQSSKTCASWSPIAVLARLIFSIWVLFCAAFMRAWIRSWEIGNENSYTQLFWKPFMVRPETSYLKNPNRLFFLKNQKNLSSTYLGDPLHVVEIDLRQVFIIRFQPSNAVLYISAVFWLMSEYLAFDWSWGGDVWMIDFPKTWIKNTRKYRNSVTSEHEEIVYNMIAIFILSFT